MTETGLVAILQALGRVNVGIFEVYIASMKGPLKAVYRRIV